MQTTEKPTEVETIGQVEHVTVAQLIEYLKQFDSALPIAFQLFSEQTLLDLESISVQECCLPRPDGWIQHQRPDKPTQQYLMFPGN